MKRTYEEGVIGGDGRHNKTREGGVAEFWWGGQRFVDHLGKTVGGAGGAGLACSKGSESASSRFE